MLAFFSRRAPLGLRRLPFARSMCVSLTEKEIELRDVLKKQLEAESVDVVDVSGGCGAMFKINVVSPLFAGKRVLAQHRLVHEALRDHIPDMHGLTLTTKAPVGAKDRE